MSFVMAAPELMASAASDLAGIASRISEANVAAAATAAVLPAAGDEVSVAIASLFSGHAQAYQALTAQAATFHQQFLQALSRAGIAYAAAEAANASVVQTVQIDALSAVNAPTEALLGRPLIGNGTNGAPGSGQNGGSGGLFSGTAAPAGPAPGEVAAAPAVAPDCSATAATAARAARAPEFCRRQRRRRWGRWGRWQRRTVPR